MYMVSAGVVWVNNNETGKRSLGIQRNGNTLIAQDEYSAASAGSTLQSVSTIIRLNAADFVELLVRQTSGLTTTIAGIADDRNYLAMAWLGP